MSKKDKKKNKKRNKQPGGFPFSFHIETPEHEVVVDFHGSFSFSAMLALKTEAVDFYNNFGQNSSPAELVAQVLAIANAANDLAQKAGASASGKKKAAEVTRPAAKPSE